ncbi:MAG: hypothetical protein K2H30_04310 [Clostridia bacterium]|nr:hypothetical protein [Clostridia bacterium]
MSLYVRLINKDNWMQGKKKTELNGEAITIDWNCKDNEWSVFKCDDSAVNLKKNEKLNKIVLRMVADNPSKTKKGINLLVLDKDFIDKINTTIIEDPELLGCKHCNIKNIN